MSIKTETIQMINMLPDEELGLIHAIVKKVIKAWDPDFTKLTAVEKKQLEQSEKSFSDGNYFSSEDVWKKDN